MFLTRLTNIIVHCDGQVALCTAVAAPPVSMGAVSAVVLLCAHNYCLYIWPGWENWVVSEHRDYTSLIDMNKEGILSLPSYWAIYLLGQVAGRALLLAPANSGSHSSRRIIHSHSRQRANRSPSATRSASGRSGMAGEQSNNNGLYSPEHIVAMWHRRSKQLGAVVGLLWLFTLLTVTEPPHGLGLQPSRRLLNAPYTCWLLAQCGTWLLSFLLLELHAPLVPRELEQRGLDLVLAISDQLLPTFLVANIATVRDHPRLSFISLLGTEGLCCGSQGAVNLSIETMYVSNRGAAMILLLYLAVLCGAVTAAAVWKRRSTAETARPGAGKMR